MRPKPRKLKVLAGTHRKDRDRREAAPLPALDSIPPPPAWLPNTHALAEYKRLALILIANGLLTRGNVALLSHLAATHGLLVDAYARGETPAAAHLTALRALHGDLGLLGTGIPLAAAKRETRFSRFSRTPAR
jgi:phage terminase small subunit